MSPYCPGRTRSSKALNDLAQRRLRERRVANRGSFYLNTNKGNGRLRKKQQLRSPQRLSVFKNDPQWFFLLPQKLWALLPLAVELLMRKRRSAIVPTAFVDTIGGTYQ